MDGSPDAMRTREGAYGEAWADRYDSIFAEVDPDAIAFLESRAGPERRALELAVGTGRVAIPLAEAGVEVWGIDISPAMLGKLAAKPGASAVTVIQGDMVDVPVESTFPLIFIAFNSFFGISSQERQVECFRNVALHLEPGGRFVLECFVPDMKRFDENHRHESERTLEQDGSVHIERSVHEPHTQRVESVIVTKHGDGSEAELPVSIRYAWPAELDLMAQMSGLHLEQRVDWYDEKPFDADSVRHVSVYGKPGGE